MSIAHQYQTDFARSHVDKGRAEGQAEGQAQGQAKSVLTFLDARGIPVDDAARARIEGCADLEQLDRWVRLAATVGSVDDLFG